MRKTIVLKRNDEYEWERWFAWHPIWMYTIDKWDGSRVELQTRIWWEWVERRNATAFDVNYEYRLPKSIGTKP